MKFTLPAICGAIVWMSITALVASAQQPASDEDAPPAKAPPIEAPEAETAPSSLDDLLDIDEGQDDEPDEGDADAARRDRQEELDRELAEVELADAFAVAMSKMSVSADLLDNRFDPGLGTQRVQEDIIAKLNQLIDKAGKCKSACSGSSSSSSSSKPSKSPSAGKPGKQSSKAQASPPSSGRKPCTGDCKPGQCKCNATDSNSTDAPAMQQGDINTVLEEEGTEWGSLPQRVRDMLLQGRKERPSGMYRELTEAYYKRLAEDGAP